jgi:predicted phosphodiesterase
VNFTAISHLRDECIDIYKQTLSFRETARVLCDKYPNLPNWNHTRGLIAEEIRDALSEEDISPDEASLRAQKQLQVDVERRERAQQREQDRKNNATEALLTEISSDLRKIGKKLRTTQRYTGKYKPKNPVLVVHLSDLHLQELIDVPGNRFDFVVASQRLELPAQKVKLTGAAYGSQKVVVAVTGDLINSDRRHDEVLNNATNRSKAVVLGVHLLRQFLLDLRSAFYVDVIGVCGNEGRAKQELAWSDLGATDSYDSLVYWCLQQTLDGDSGLRFNELQANECLFTIHGTTFLAVHGHQIKMSDQRAVQSLIAKHTQRGVTVSHVIAGHIHSTMISDFASRNSSLCGSNSYSDAALNYVSKAAQNLHVITEHHHDTIKLDLQNTDGVKGYDVLSELERMEARTTDQQFKSDKQLEPIQIT